MEDIVKYYPPPNRQGQDILIWGKKGDRKFHIKFEAYQVAMGLGTSPKDQSGLRYGTPNYGPKWPPFYG